VVPDTITQQEVPVVDVSVPEAASSIPELTPTTITTLTDGSEVVTRFLDHSRRAKSDADCFSTGLATTCSTISITGSSVFS
jgi:hypothetical protein